MSNDRKTKEDVDELLKNAHAEGEVSEASMKALELVDPGAQIAASLGVRVDDVSASEVVLVTLMPDDSGSIAQAHHAKVVREGHNLVLDALAASQQTGSILVHCRYLNGNVLYPFCPLDRAVKMDGANYHPDGGTPLYDETVALLGTVLAKSREFSESGVPVRTVTLLLTDGADVHSQRARPADVAALVRDLTSAGNHIVAAMGIADGTTDFRAVFRDMGIDDRWILTPGNSAAELRRAFQVFSQSAVRASRSAASFATTAAGGFVN
jgi:hypothetical protein